ncbi:hypothetical protein QUF86_08280 [Peribacillus sp. NJ11]|uniref:hypothetical protein n=1 Tax=Peribacillus sp. NJ11 TaxID=3055861 RepID=UPI0025A251B7|nr:hypothetical protein [Peribacillus sp. NJ11]MDM5220749.1 hypothetical protein [Peribacillus sp. NJ11]
MTNKKKQVLVGSPIYHKPHILQKFLLSLERLDVEGMEIGHFFIDDNEDERSRKFGYMTFGMKPITGWMNSGALTSTTGRSWSGIVRGLNASGTIGRSIPEMFLNCLTSYLTYA